MTKGERMKRDAMELDRLFKKAEKIHLFEKLRKAKIKTR